MKTLFIEAKYKGKVELPKAFMARLPKRVMLFSTVQFLSSIVGIKDQLERSGREVVILRSMHGRHASQLLGCTIKSFDEAEFDAFLYIGDGEFHPKALLIKNKKEVFCYNPFTQEEKVLGEKDIEYIEKRKRAGLLKFLSGKRIGVLITTKPGQCRINEAFALPSKFPDKEFYFLIDNTLDFSQLENFPFLECIVNTACPRIGYDDYEKFAMSVVNIDDVYEVAKGGEAGEQKKTSDVKFKDFGSLDAETVQWLNRVGIYTLDDLKIAGVKDAHDRLREAGYTPKNLMSSLKNALE